MNHAPLDDPNAGFINHTLQHLVAQQGETLLWEAQHRKVPYPYGVVFFVTLWTIVVLLLEIFMLWYSFVFVLFIISLPFIGLTFFMVYHVYKDIQQGRLLSSLSYGLSTTAFWISNDDQHLALSLEDLSYWSKDSYEQTYFVCTNPGLMQHPLLQIHEEGEAEFYTLSGFSHEAQLALLKQLELLGIDVNED